MWDETCRIKHLPTRMYLAIKKGTAVSEHESLNFDQYQVQVCYNYYVHQCACLYNPLKLCAQPTLVSKCSCDYGKLTVFKLFQVIHQVLSHAMK